MGKKRNRQKLPWTPPKNARSYFSRSADDEFKEQHPVGYKFLVALGMIALFLPVIVYMIFTIPLADNSPWLMLGWVGAFIIGIGLFNFVAIIIKQYLGHWVSVLSFVLGSLFVWISLVQMGIL